MVDQNDVSEEPIKGLRDGSIGGAVDDNAGGGQIVGCGEVHVDDNATYGQNVDDNATHGQTSGVNSIPYRLVWSEFIVSASEPVQKHS